MSPALEAWDKARIAMEDAKQALLAIQKRRKPKPATDGEIAVAQALYRTAIANYEQAENALSAEEWRARPATDLQLKRLAALGEMPRPEMTSGEASDLYRKLTARKCAKADEAYEAAVEELKRLGVAK